MAGMNYPSPTESCNTVLFISDYKIPTIETLIEISLKIDFSKIPYGVSLFNKSIFLIFRFRSHNKFKLYGENPSGSQRVKERGF